MADEMECMAPHNAQVEPQTQHTVPQGEKLEKADPDLSYRPIFCALALFMRGTRSMAARRQSPWTHQAPLQGALYSIRTPGLLDARKLWASAQFAQMGKDFHVERLADEFGQYELYPKCESCLHERSTTPHLLAKICGWDANVGQRMALCPRPVRAVAESPWKRKSANWRRPVQSPFRLWC
jgi:hypothetical protein